MVDESMTPYIATLWLRAFKKIDYESLRGLYHHDALQYCPKIKFSQPKKKGSIEGSTQFTYWWQGKTEFKKWRSLTVKAIEPVGNKILIDYNEHPDALISLLVREVLVVSDGLIIASRVYYD